MNAEIVITGWGSPVFPDHLSAEDSLRLVVHSAGTVRTLIPRSLIEDGVRVSHAPAGMATSVAELAMFFTLTLLRRLPDVERLMAKRDWVAARELELSNTVAGASIGVIGASRVGRAYIQLVVAAGATVVVYDPYLPPSVARELGVELVSLAELLDVSSVVAVHAPVTSETRKMLDAEHLSRIRDGGIVVNTARSAVIDTDALTAELRSGRLSAGLDVFDEEPLDADSELWRLPNVIVTPHLGARTNHSRQTQGRIVVEEVERFVRGLPLQQEILAETYERLA